IRESACDMVPLTVVYNMASLDPPASHFHARHSRLQKERPAIPGSICSPRDHWHSVCARGFYPGRAGPSASAANAIETRHHHKIIRSIKTDRAVKTTRDPLIRVIGESLQLSRRVAARLFRREALDFIKRKPIIAIHE